MIDHGQGKNSHGIGFFPTGEGFHPILIPLVEWKYAFETMINLAARLPWYVRLWRWVSEEWRKFGATIGNNTKS